MGVLGSGSVSNVILDHVSASWGLDECLSLTNHSDNVTVQNSYITEALNSAGHAYGSLLRPEIQSHYTMSHNLTYTKGAHELRFGFDLVRHHLNHWQPEVGQGPRGYLGFGGGATALGQPAAGGRDRPRDPLRRRRLSRHPLPRQSDHGKRGHARSLPR